MMQFRIHTNSYVYLAILLFLVPIRWLTAWLLAVICHELCHYIAVKLCGGNVFSLTVSIGGAIMESSGLSDGKQLISIFAGPIGGLIPTVFARWFPELALCCWLLSMYNLLPLLPLDGGHILQLLIKNPKRFLMQQRICRILLLLGGVYLSFCLGLGILPIAIAIGLCLKCRKNPCNESVCGVQ